MRSILVVSLILCALATEADRAVGSTQAQLMSAGQLGRAATAIVRGEVAGQRSFWNDQHTKILTEIEVAVAETYKGAARPLVRVVQLGGVVGNVRVTAHGALAWREGEEVLLFLEPAGDGRLQVSGFSQGKFSIERDARTGEAFVSRPFPEGIELVGDGSGARAEEGAQKVPLRTLLNRALAAQTETGR